VGVNCHLDLIGSEMLDGIGYFGIAVETRYHELLQELMGCDFLQKRRIKDSQDGGS